MNEKDKIKGNLQRNVYMRSFVTQLSLILSTVKRIEFVHIDYMEEMGGIKCCRMYAGG